MIRPSMNHVALPANVGWLQNVDFTPALLGVVIAYTDYKEVCTSFKDTIRQCHEYRYEVNLHHLLTKWLSNFGFPFSLSWSASFLDGGGFLPSTEVNSSAWAVFLAWFKGQVAIAILTSGAQKGASHATSHKGSLWGRGGEIHFQATFEEIKVNEYKANLAKVREKLELECKAKNKVE